MRKQQTASQLDHIRKVGYANRTHGLSSNSIYATWQAMIRRCRDVEYDGYENYGGRGIRVCERWLQIDNFVADMWPRPNGASLDRIDVDGNYEPGNCRWVSQRDQMQNMRTTTRFTLHGVTKSLHDWATELGVSPRTLAGRRRRGWTDEKILTTPVDKKLSWWKPGDAPNPHGRLARNRSGRAA